MDNGFADITSSSRDRLVPANPEAEQAVLGSILIDPDAVIRVAAFLKADDFYQEKNGWIYQAILDLHERREPADFLTVTDELDRRRQLDEVGGPAYVMDLINAVPTAIHVEHYARIVERTSVLRKLIRAAGQIAQIAYEETTEDIGEVVDRAEQIVFSVAERRAQRDLVAVRTLMGDVVDRIDFLYHHRGEILGVPTGFKLLDKMLGGLQKSDLVILAARPGVGKTSLAISLAQNAARKYGKRVAVFSLEMSNEQLVQRMLSAETGIDSQRLRLGDIQGEDEWHRLMEAAGALSDAPIYIDDTPAVSAMELPLREPRPGDQRHLARPQGPGPRAERARAGPQPAFARRGEQARQTTDPVGSTREWRNRAGRGRGHVHLPRRDVQRRHGKAKYRRRDHRQTPQRPHRIRLALLPQGTDPVPRSGDEARGVGVDKYIGTQVNK